MTSHLIEEKEMLKLLFDVFCENPRMKALKDSDLIKVAEIARNYQNCNIDRAEITEDLLASIDSVEDLKQIETSGYLGRNRKQRVWRRL